MTIARDPLSMTGPTLRSRRVLLALSQLDPGGDAGADDWRRIDSWLIFGADRLRLPQLGMVRVVYPTAAASPHRFVLVDGLYVLAPYCRLRYAVESLDLLLDHYAARELPLFLGEPNTAQGVGFVRRCRERGNLPPLSSERSEGAA